MKIKKVIHISLTILLMLGVSRFVIRLVDATVQIDDNLGILLILLALLNGVIAFASYKIGKWHWD